MCQSKNHGGRRCVLSKERRARRNEKRRNQYATEKFVVKQTEAHEEWLNEADAAIKQFQHDSTPAGLASLKAEVDALSADDKSDEAKALIARYRQVAWAAQFEESRRLEEENGRQNDISTLFQKLPESEGFDDDEFDSIVTNVRYYKERMAARMTRSDKDFSKPVTQEAWNKYLDTTEETLKENNVYDEEAQETLAKLRAGEAPDTISLSSYSSIKDYITQAKTEQEKQITTAAHLIGAKPEDATRYFEAYRKQYQEIEKNDPDNAPTVPSSWVAGRFKDSGMVKQKDSSIAPADNASMYALYRIRVDEEALPESIIERRNIASIDLETASAKGESAAAVNNGRIIEVGIVEYTPEGKEVGRYSQLIRPETEFLEKHGTGAQDIHNIAPSDLDGQPTWDEVKDQVMVNLKGRTLLAQNADFEKRWLSGKSEEFKNAVPPVADSLEVARKHLEMPTYKLGNICAEVKVAYTDGHRATHDAEVTGEAFFEMKRRIRAEWFASAARRNAPKLNLEG
jgi:DNA polymerase III epsilon subunit-like protein